MYAVIFRAKINELDDEYLEMACHMRELAKTDYGCVEFVAVSEGDEEIAISYWNTLEQIDAWKQDPQHRVAQELGRSKWYKSFQVQLTEIVR